MTERTKNILLPVCWLLIVFASGVAYYFYKQAESLRRNPEQVAQDEIAEVVRQVGEIMVLPEGEQPTVATVADPSKLKDQPFFARAKVGDKVLLYPNARKAILYDPVTHKIIEVAPISIGNPTTPTAPPAPSPAPAPQPPATSSPAAESRR